MEAAPLLELYRCALAFLLAIPTEHAVRVFEADFFTVALDDAVWIVEEVVCVDERDIHFTLCISVDVAVSVAIGMTISDIPKLASFTSVRLLAGDLGSDLSDILEEVEDSAELVVTGFRRVELAESSNLIQRRDRAAIVRRDTASWVAD